MFFSLKVKLLSNNNNIYIYIFSGTLVQMSACKLRTMPNRNNAKQKEKEITNLQLEYKS